MKWFIVILLALFCYAFTATDRPNRITTTVKRDTVPTGAAPQLFGGKLYEFKNYVLIDSFLLKKGGDTFATPRWPAIQFKTSDRSWYGHDSLRWSRFITSANQNIQWCNVQQAGADTSGTIDASPYINALISSGCRYLYFPRGRYLISSTIQMRDSIVVKGDGRQNTIIKLTTNIPAFKASYSLGGQKCEFRDIAFQGTLGAGGTTDQVGILIDSTSGSLMHNIGGYQMGGFVVNIKRNGFCCGVYPTNAVRGNTVSDSYFQGCYGAVSLDTIAEYNVVSSVIAVNGTYGIFVAGGNNSINGCNLSSNEYGLYVTGGSNNGHGTATGNVINHNSTSDIYCTGVTLGFAFVGNMVYAGPVQVTLINSDNLNFNGGDIMAGTITVNTCTNTTFNDVRISSSAAWTITGIAPTVIRNGKSINTISITDVLNSKEFTIDATNGTANFAGTGLVRMRMKSDTLNFSNPGVAHYLMGGENNSDSLVLSSTTSSTKGKINFGASSTYSESAISLGIGTTNPLRAIHLRRAVAANLDFAIQNESTASGATNRILFFNDAGASAQIFQGSAANPFMPSGLELTTTGASGVRLAPTAGDISFGASTTNAVSDYARFKIGTGSFLFGTATDVPSTGRFQINSRARIDSLLRLYNVAAPPSAYNVLVHNLTDSGTYQIPASALAGAPTLEDVLTNGPNFSNPHTSILAGNTWNFTGTQSTNSMLNVSNSGNGEAISAVTTGTGSALSTANSGSGTGATISSNTGTAVNTTSTSGTLFRGIVNPSSTNTELVTLRTIRQSSGTPAAGMGQIWSQDLEDDAGNNIQAVQHKSVWTSAVGGATSADYQLWSVNAGTLAQKFTIKSTGQAQLNVGYGSVSFSGTPVSSIQSDVGGNLINGPLLAAGTYTPTLTNGTNVAASTPYVCQYSRVGNTVTVSGKADIDPTAVGATVLGISLPIASALTDDFQAAGTTSAGIESYAGSIKADATNDRVQVDFVIPTTGSIANTSWYFTFTYLIL